MQGQTTWFSRLEKNIQELDLSKCIRNKSPLNIVGKLTVKKLVSNYEEYWEKEIFKEGNRNNKACQGGNKLRTYRKFKGKFYTEKYLLNIENAAKRRAMTQLRAGSHQLNIEPLRGKIKFPNLRTCILQCIMSKYRT